MEGGTLVMQVLVVNEKTKGQIAAIRNHADAKDNYNVVRDVIMGVKPPPGDDPRHVVEIPFGFRAVYSVDLDTNGNTWRHMTVSQADAPYPNGDAFLALCDEFGFDPAKMIVQLQDGIGHVIEPLAIHPLNIH